MVVFSNGDCLWVPPGLFLSTCKINIAWFPFDDQQCAMKFGSWTYDGGAINLTLQADTGDISSFIENGEWQLVGKLPHLTAKMRVQCHFTKQREQPKGILRSMRDKSIRVTSDFPFQATSIYWKFFLVLDAPTSVNFSLQCPSGLWLVCVDLKPEF